MSVGVVVGRFQVDTLHEGHQTLLRIVNEKNGKLCICLGVSPTKISERDPLDYHTRAIMLASLFPTASIMPIHDHPSDKEWSNILDEMLLKAYPTDRITLYGSRKSFLALYTGRLNKEYVEEAVHTSGEITRAQIAGSVENNDSFRRGIIYASQNRYPISYQVVDVAVLKGELHDPLILLCSKKEESEPGRLRFIGGFVDPRDSSLEEAAVREVREESGVEVKNIKYIGSAQIDDWRYRDRRDKIMSAMFVAEYKDGEAKAQDDISMLEYVPWQTALSPVEDSPILMYGHRQLGIMLHDFIQSRQKKRMENIR